MGFHYFMDVARRCGAEILDKKAGIALADRPLRDSATS